MSLIYVSLSMSFIYVSLSMSLIYVSLSMSLIYVSLSMSLIYVSLSIQVVKHHKTALVQESRNIRFSGDNINESCINCNTVTGLADWCVIMHLQ